MQQNSPQVRKTESYSATAQNQINPKLCFRGTDFTLSVTTPSQAQQSPAQAVRVKQCHGAVRELERGGDGKEKLRIWASAFFPFNKITLVILLNKC